MRPERAVVGEQIASQQLRAHAVATELHQVECEQSKQHDMSQTGPALVVAHAVGWKRV